MRNSKSQGEALYEKIMSELEPIVKTVLGEAMGVKKPMNKQLNELSLPTKASAVIKAGRYGNNSYVEKILDDYDNKRESTKMYVDSELFKIICVTVYFDENQFVKSYNKWDDKYDYTAIASTKDVIYSINIDFYDSEEDYNKNPIMFRDKKTENTYEWGDGSFTIDDEYLIDRNKLTNVFSRQDAKRIADWINKTIGSHLSWRNFYGNNFSSLEKIDESKKTPKSKKLNEMSDEMLNRAIVAAVDKGDFERAKKFSDYRKSDIRKENLNKIPFKKGELDTRSINFLKANGINSPYQLLNMTKDEFYALKPGKKTMMMILDYLDGYFNDTHLNKYYR